TAARSDSEPTCADHPAHRAARVASNVIRWSEGKRETERSWREYLSAGRWPRANLRKMGRQPRGRRGDSPRDALRTAEGTRGASRGPFSTARERGLGSKSQIPAKGGEAA